MHVLEIATESTEYLLVPVRASEAGELVDPTAGAVRIAFVTPGAKPIAANWEDAQWETVDDRYYARVLVGAGGAQLARGVYAVWIEITDAPEKPVREVGRVRIY